MNENNKLDDSDFDISPRNNNNKEEEKKDYFEHKYNKKTVKRSHYRSKSVANDEKNKNRNREVNLKRNNEEEKKESNIKKPNFLLKSGKLTKIFLKNKDDLIKKLNSLKHNNKNNEISSPKSNFKEYNDKNKEMKKRQNNFKLNRNNSCIELRPRKKKISVTCLKFAQNVSRDHDGLILFKNGLGVNDCFLNAIIQVLYHLDEFRNKLMNLDIKKVATDPVVQLYTIFNKYESLSKLNTIEMLNAALLRKALHAKLGKYPKGKFGDPMETILELLELIHKEYFDKNEKSNPPAKDNKNNNEFCSNEKCPSHSNFLIYLKEVKYCPECKTLTVQKYDKDCFMFTVLSYEILSLIKDNPFSNYKYSLFPKLKYLSQKFGQNDKPRLDKCKCKNISTKKKLLLYKKISPFLIINITWDSDFPKITDICKIYGLIPLKDKNENIFNLDIHQKKELSTNYYLSSMILFGQRHYTCFFYNKEIKMWSFADDESKINYSTYNELIKYLIGRRSIPVGIIFTCENIFKNEKEEKYLVIEEQFNELYQNCAMIEKIENEENEKLLKMKKANENNNNKNDIKENNIEKNEKAKKPIKEENKNNKKSNKDEKDSDDISF